jgi:hypothetical protein
MKREQDPGHLPTNAASGSVYAGRSATHLHSGVRNTGSSMSCSAYFARGCFGENFSGPIPVEKISSKYNVAYVTPDIRIRHPDLLWSGAKIGDTG